MLSRDLTATVIKTFFAELADIRDGKRGGEEERAFAGLYLSHFNRERDWFINAKVEEISTFLADDPIHKLEMLVELMYQDSRRLTSRELQAAIQRKIINLYDVIDARSMEFSMERMNRVEELKNLLNE